MALARWQAQIVNRYGNVVPNAQITVRHEAPGLPLVSPLYDDRDGVTPKSNPFNADSDGYAFFHAAAGTYRIRAYDPTKGFERIWRYVDVGGTPPGFRSVSVTQFGALGDGHADDTAAFAMAIAACKNSKLTLRVPTGEYLVDTIEYTSNDLSNQFDWVGDGRNQTIIKKRSTSAEPLLKIGDGASTNHIAEISISGITFDGLNDTTAASVLLYDLVRSKFEDCIFKNADKGLHSRGGIANSYINCDFDANNIGIYLDKFTSLAGGGYPNFNVLSACRLVNNAEWGAYFDHGVMLTLRDCNVEGNGGGLGDATGGVLSGANVGEAVAGTDTLVPGLLLDACWFEGNKGTADIQSQSGILGLRGGWFRSIAADITHDIYITGGQYHVENADSSFTKAANVLEDSGTVSGSTLKYSNFGALNVNGSKCTFFGSKRLTRSFSGLNIESNTDIGDSDYAILPADRTVSTNAAFSAPRTVTLPAANAVNAGTRLVVRDKIGTVTATNTLTLARAGSDTINGGTSVVIREAYGGFLLESDGVSAWTAYPLNAPTAWTSYTPIVTAHTGMLTSASATGRYKIVGKTVFFEINALITTNGTGDVAVIITLPFNSAQVNTVLGKEIGVSGKLIGTSMTIGSPNLTVQFYDGAYPGADGARLVMTGVYEIS